MKYKLDVKRDVDVDADGFILNLPYGYRFYDDLIHVKGYDTMRELKRSARTEVIQCDCLECSKHK